MTKKILLPRRAEELKVAFAVENEPSLSYVDTGDPRGVPVVLMHAFPLNKGMRDDRGKVRGREFLKDEPIDPLYNYSQVWLVWTPQKAYEIRVADGGYFRRSGWKRIHEDWVTERP